MEQRERLRPWRILWSGIAVIAVVSISAIVLIQLLVTATFDIPVRVLLCGSSIDLETLNVEDVPAGCVIVPVGIDLDMRSPDVEAVLLQNGWFGFRDLEENSYDATLVARGAIASTTMDFVAIESGGGGRSSGPMNADIAEDGTTEWTGPVRISPEVTSVIIVLVTSPESPPNNA